MVMEKVKCIECVYHKTSLISNDVIHICKNRKHAYTTEFDKEIHKAAIYGITESMLTFGKCMEKNKDNNCKHFKPNLHTRFIDWINESGQKKAKV